jgi:hypothetical protein
MTIPAELSQVARTLTYNGSGTTAEVGIGTTVNITGGLEIKGIQVISPAGVWQGSAAGIQGTQGTQGITGTQGTQGIQGIQGSQGIQGTQGIQGILGTQGIQGSQGIQGTQGIQGATGSQGTTGTTGSTGTQGTTGTQGIQGIAGPSTQINATAVTTNATFYPVFVAAAGSNQTASVRTTSQAFQFNPGTGELQLGGQVTLGTTPFFRNTTTISSNYTVATSYNEMSIGPITVNSGVTVTVDSGASWTLV